MNAIARLSVQVAILKGSDGDEIEGISMVVYLKGEPRTVACEMRGAL